MIEDLSREEAEVQQLIELLDRARPTHVLRIACGDRDEASFCGRAQNALLIAALEFGNYEWLGYCALDDESKQVCLALLRVGWNNVEMKFEHAFEQCGMEGEVWSIIPRSAEIDDFAVDLMAAAIVEGSGCVCFSSGAWPLAAVLPWPVVGSDQDEDRGGVFL